MGMVLPMSSASSSRARSSPLVSAPAARCTTDISTQQFSRIASCARCNGCKEAGLAAGVAGRTLDIDLRARDVGGLARRPEILAVPHLLRRTRGRQQPAASGQRSAGMQTVSRGSVPAARMPNELMAARLVPHRRVFAAGGGCPGGKRRSERGRPQQHRGLGELRARSAEVRSDQANGSGTADDDRRREPHPALH